MAGRRSRLLLWALGALLAILAALAWIGWQWAESDECRAWLVSVWQEKVRTALDAELKVESVEGNPLFGLRAHGVSISRDGHTSIYTEELHLAANIPAMLAGRLRLTEMRLVRPRVSLPLNLRPVGRPPDTTITGLEIENGRVETHGQWGAVSAVEGINITGGLVFDARGLAIEVNLQGASLHLGPDRPVLNLQARGTVYRYKLVVDALSVEAGDSRLEMNGELGWLQDLQFKAASRLHLARASDLPWTWPGPVSPAGPLGLEIKLAGTPRQAELEARLSQGVGRLELQGQVGLEDLSLDLQGRLQALNLAALGLSPQPVELGGNLHLASKGWPGRAGATGSLSLALDHLTAWGQTGGRASLEASWDQSQLKVPGFSLRGPWGQLEGAGQATWAAAGQPPEIQAGLGFSDLTAPATLAEHLPPWLHQARTQGRLEVKGTPADLALTLELGPSPLVPGLDISRLSAKGGLRGEAWRLESLAVQAGEAEFKALGAAGPAGVDLDMSLQTPSLGRLLGPLAAAGLSLPPQASGALDAKARLKGPWSALGLKLQANARDLELNGLTAQEASLTLATERLALPAAGEAKLALRNLRQGGLTWERASLDLTAAAGAARLEASAQGPDLSLAFRLLGPAATSLPLEARLEGLSLAWGRQRPWVQQGRAGLTWSPDTLGVQGLALAQGEQTLRLEGGLGRDGALAGSLRLSQVRLGYWLPDRALARNAVLEAEAGLNGSLAAPRLTLAGRLGGLAWGKLPPSELTFQGGVQDGLLSLQGQALIQGRPSLDFAGSLGLEASLAPRRLRLSERGLQARLRASALPLALLEPVLPPVSGLAGRAELELTASGPVDAPQVQGGLHLREGAFTISATGQAFHDIAADLSVQGREVRVDNLSLLSGGPLTLSGRVVLPLGGQGQNDLRLEAKDFRVSLGTLGEVVCDAKLGLQGAPGQPFLNGFLQPRRATIHPRLASPTALADVVILEPGQTPPPLRPEGRRAPRWAPTGWLAALAMDVRLEVPPGFRMQVDEGFLELAGQMALRKAEGGPLTFHDRIQVPRGAIILQGKRFEVADGLVDFKGKDQPDPDLKATASMHLGSTVVLVSVQGTAFDPQLNLSSEPPMSQTDILSTIIFGRPAGALNAGETRQLSAQALALLGQRGRREMERLLGPTLAPDVVTVYNELQMGSSLEAGKYLSPDLYLRYRRNLGPEGGQNVGLELRLNPYMSLESQVGNTLDSGVDIIFNFDFDRGVLAPALVPK